MTVITIGVRVWVRVVKIVCMCNTPINVFSGGERGYLNKFRKIDGQSSHPGAISSVKIPSWDN